MMNIKIKNSKSDLLSSPKQKEFNHYLVHKKPVSDFIYKQISEAVPEIAIDKNGELKVLQDVTVDFSINLDGKVQVEKIKAPFNGEPLIYRTFLNGVVWVSEVKPLPEINTKPNLKKLWAMPYFEESDIKCLT